MDELKKLTLPKQLLAGGGVLLFLAYFFEWFSFGIGSYSGSDVGFLWSTLPWLAGIAAAALVLLPVFGVKLPDGTPWDMIAAICGCLGALVVIKLLIGESESAFGVTVTADRSFGLYIAAIAGIAMCAGGVMALMNQNKASS